MNWMNICRHLDTIGVKNAARRLVQSCENKMIYIRKTSKILVVEQAIETLLYFGQTWGVQSPASDAILFGPCQSSLSFQLKLPCKYANKSAYNLFILVCANYYGPNLDQRLFPWVFTIFAIK